MAAVKSHLRFFSILMLIILLIRCSHSSYPVISDEHCDKLNLAFLLSPSDLIMSYSGAREIIHAFMSAVIQRLEVGLRGTNVATILASSPPRLLVPFSSSKSRNYTITQLKKANTQDYRLNMGTGLRFLTEIFSNLDSTRKTYRSLALILTDGSIHINSTDVITAAKQLRKDANYLELYVIAIDMLLDDQIDVLAGVAGSYENYIQVQDYTKLEHTVEDIVGEKCRKDKQ